RRSAVRSGLSLVGDGGGSAHRIPLSGCHDAGTVRALSQAICRPDRDRTRTRHPRDRHQAAAAGAVPRPTPQRGGVRRRGTARSHRAGGAAARFLRCSGQLEFLLRHRPFKPRGGYRVVPAAIEAAAHDTRPLNKNLNALASQPDVHSQSRQDVSPAVDRGHRRIGAAEIGRRRTDDKSHERRLRGPIMPVNPKATALHGIMTYKDVASLPLMPDLAVIAKPPDTIPGLVDELGRRGTRAAVILTAGFAEGEAAAGKARSAQMLAAARPYLMRIVGPNCLGIAVPGVGLNATFAPAALLPGNIAFLTQSGAMATTVLDWALPRGIGFSAIVSMGDMSDVDFGDLLDYFALDEATHAILIYAEGITQARKFMSAARRTARIKPIIVVKSGRAEEGARAASSHTGALAGADVVYDAAFRRAGMLRVNEVEELFDAAATLARMSPQRGNRLAIVTNGGGAGVLATDRLIEEGGKLATLSPDVIAKLNAVLPPTWSHANPIDLIGDADAGRYANSVSILIDDPGNDALLVAYCPTAIGSSAEAAKGLIGVLSKSNAAKKNVFACWMGAATVAEGRAQLIDAQLPDFETPERAVRAFMYLVRYRQNQDLLLETPTAGQPSQEIDLERARGLIRQALDDRREWLDPAEVAAFLACYNIPFARTQSVQDAKSAADAARQMNAPVALKIRSRDVVHKSDVGGVALNLTSPAEVAAAAARMNEKILQALPKARLEGFIVQEMIHRPSAYELIAGVSTDPTFGPVILFGQGGTAVEIVRDKSLELPPLNRPLARAQIERTRIAALLKGY